MIRKKLEGNGLWESSRMMLPEHKDQILRRNRLEDTFQGKRPELDDGELERIIKNVQNSFQNRIPIEVRLYDPQEVLIVAGIVEKIEPVSGWFQVGGDRFRLTDIIQSTDEAF
jgi:putative heme degradation protein